MFGFKSKTETKRINLEQLKIASPCTMDWAQMKGDDRVRHCGACKLNVYNIAGLSRVEAEALVGRHMKGERVCMRLLRRKDGTLITRDCPVGVHRLRVLRTKLALVAFPFVAAAMYWTGRQVAAQEQTQTQVLQGDVALPVEQPVELKGKPMMGAPAPQQPEMGEPPPVEATQGLVAPPDEE